MNTCAKGCCTGPHAQRDHYRSLRLGADRNQTFSNGWTLATERQEERDIDAYLRMRKQGLQPADYSGCETLEKRATAEIEIEHGQIMPPALIDAFQTVKSET